MRHVATTDSAAALVEVPRWELHEFELHGPCRAENPFRDAALAGEFTAPSGKTTIAEGFYDGDDTWRLRFAPNEEGEWRYRLHGEGVDIRQEGRLKCVTPRGHGFIGIHPQKQVHHTDKVRRTSWRIVCAGGYFAAGFHGTIGHSDAWNRIDAPNRYTFTVRDEGAARQLGALHDFFTALPFWRMQPFEGVTGAAAVALAEPGKVYVVYLPQGGKVTVDLSAAPAPLTAQWFNPRDGRAGEPFSVPADKPGTFQSSDGQDWVLQLRETSR